MFNGLLRQSYLNFLNFSFIFMLLLVDNLRVSALLCELWIQIPLRYLNSYYALDATKVMQVLFSSSIIYEIRLNQMFLTEY
ncbi:MAG: hypothetical protein DWQ10_07860 [Calditrichaeota bacterium]|nr:MAG: hypothetical protein DWQ10_07860 [Calditrichota bacterium]